MPPRGTFTRTRADQGIMFGFVQGDRIAVLRERLQLTGDRLRCHRERFLVALRLGEASGQGRHRHDVAAFFCRTPAAGAHAAARTAPLVSGRGRRRGVQARCLRLSHQTTVAASMQRSPVNAIAGKELAVSGRRPLVSAVVVPVASDALSAVEAMVLVPAVLVVSFVAGL